MNIVFKLPNLNTYEPNIVLSRFCVYSFKISMPHSTTDIFSSHKKKYLQIGIIEATQGALHSVHCSTNIYKTDYC